MREIEYLLKILAELGPLLVAVACGGLIGLERETRGKPAGVKTAMLICLGSAAFVQASSFLVGAQTDPSRVLGQVITGIGFLGAGAIITHRGQVIGLTTAATIWVTAAVGVALGLGWYARGIAWTVLCVIVLQGVGLLERRLNLNGNGGPATSGASSSRPPEATRTRRPRRAAKAKTSRPASERGGARRTGRSEG